MDAQKAMEMICPFTIGPGPRDEVMASHPCRVGRCMAWRFFTLGDPSVPPRASGGYCGRIGKEGAA